MFAKALWIDIDAFSYDKSKKKKKSKFVIVARGQEPRNMLNSVARTTKPFLKQNLQIPLLLH